MRKFHLHAKNRDMLLREVQLTMVPVPSPFQMFALAVMGIIWVFVLWMLWRIVHGLKGIEDAVKQVASGEKP